MTVAPGSKVRQLYEKMPFFFNFRMYVFNVTNKDEMMQGSEFDLIASELKLGNAFFIIQNYSMIFHREAKATRDWSIFL